MPDALELVIFDCDGVLVDSEPIAVRVDLIVLAEFGLELSEDEVIERFVGRSPAVMLGVIEAHIGRRVPDRLESYEHLYKAAFEAELTAVDGVEQALDQIANPICVASSSEPESLRRKLELTGLYERFEGRVFSAGEVANGKPAPGPVPACRRADGCRPVAMRGGRGQPLRRRGRSGREHGRARHTSVASPPRTHSRVRERPRSMTCASCPNCWSPRRSSGFVGKLVVGIDEWLGVAGASGSPREHLGI